MTNEDLPLARAIRKGEIVKNEENRSNQRGGEPS